MKCINQILMLTLTSLTSFIMAQGETCASALPITSGTYAADGPATGNGSINAINADWYSFTPSTSGILSINSCGGGVDTYLTIYEGTCGALNAITYNDDACISSGTDNYASQVINLPVCIGATYYIEWDDRYSTDGFNFTLLFEPLTANDVAFQANDYEYSMLPSSAALLKASGKLSNKGSAAAVNPSVTVSIKKNGSTFIPDFSIAGPSSMPSVICTSNSTDSTEISSDWLNLSERGNYKIAYDATVVGTESNLVDNTDTTIIFVDTTFARDRGDLIDNIIGLEYSIAGQNYTLVNADLLTSVYLRAVLVDEGITFHAVIYSVDANGKPVIELGRTIDYTTTAADFNYSMNNDYIGFTLPIVGSNIPLSAGQEFFVGIEQTSPTIGIISTVGGYTPRKNWAYDMNLGFWYNAEDYDSRPTYIIRPNFGASASFLNTNPATQFAKGLSVSPNPSQGEINVSFVLNNASDIKINVIDMTGKILISSNSSANTGSYIQTLNLGNLTAGLYTVQVITNEGNATQRVVLTK